jgi:hypothetical protein
LVSQGLQYHLRGVSISFYFFCTFQIPVPGSYQTQYPGCTAFLNLYQSPQRHSYLDSIYYGVRGGGDQVVRCCITQRLRLHSRRRDEFASFRRSLYYSRGLSPRLSFNLLIFLRTFFHLYTVVSRFTTLWLHIRHFSLSSERLQSLQIVPWGELTDRTHGDGRGQLSSPDKARRISFGSILCCYSMIHSPFSFMSAIPHYTP